MIRVLLHKRTIALVAGLAIIFWIITAFIVASSVHCGPTTTSGQMNCGSATSGGVGAGVFSFIAWILTIVCWAMALVKTYRVRQWVWLVLCFILPPFTPFLFGLFGRETPVNNRPTYIEGTPRAPVMP